MTQPATTFALLRQHGACESGYRKLAKHLGGVNKYGRDKPIPLLTVLGSNGLGDTLWSLRAVLEPWGREGAFIADCAGHTKRGDATSASAEVATHRLAGRIWWVARFAALDGGSNWLTANDVATAAVKTERDWQAKRLRQYLTGKARPLKRAA